MVSPTNPLLLDTRASRGWLRRAKPGSAERGRRLAHEVDSGWRRDVTVAAAAPDQTCSQAAEGSAVRERLRGARLGREHPRERATHAGLVGGTGPPTLAQPSARSHVAAIESSRASSK